MRPYRLNATTGFEAAPAWQRISRQGGERASPACDRLVVVSRLLDCGSDVGGLLPIGADPIGDRLDRAQVEFAHIQLRHRHATQQLERAIRAVGVSPVLDHRCCCGACDRRTPDDQGRLRSRRCPSDSVPDRLGPVDRGVLDTRRAVSAPRGRSCSCSRLRAGRA